PLWYLSMEIFQGLLYGFQVALQPINLFYCFVGVFIGTLVGVLPGLGPAAAIALLLPSTFAARQSPPSSCWTESISAQCMAAQRPPFLSISPVRRRRSSPVLTAMRWRAKDGRVRLWGFPLSGLSSPGH